MRRLPGVILSLCVAVAFCIVAGIALFAEFERQADGWGHMQRGFHAGPVSKIAQPFRVPHDNLSRIDVWAYVDGGEAGAAGDVIARVIPHGADAPIRESRVRVTHPSKAGAPIKIRFSPISDSRGVLYVLELTTLSGPLPYLFLGITSSDMNPAGHVSINGDTSRAQFDLAMRPYWIGRGGRVLEHLVKSDPWRLFLVVDAALWGLLIVFGVVAAWGIHERGHWRSVIGYAAGWSVLITLGLATCAIILLLILSADPRA